MVLRMPADRFDRGAADRPPKGRSTDGGSTPFRFDRLTWFGPLICCVYILNVDAAESVVCSQGTARIVMLLLSQVLCNDGRRS